MATVQLSGFKELEQALGELPKATARNTLRRVLKRAGEPVEAAMESRAPVLTGYTEKSIAVSATLNPRNRRDIKREGKAFAEYYIGSRRGSAAVFNEFGTINMPAHPYMRPGWEASQDQALAIITKDLGTEIEKARARLARKAARAGGV